MRLNWGTAPLSPLAILEFLLVLVCVALAFTRPSLAGKVFSRIESKLAHLSRRTWLCVLVLFLFPVVLRLLLLPVYGAPAPFISDEYAYLLQSDTFASGQWSNPSPAFPGQFTSVYVLAQPTYTAEYQVAQGLMLAAGQAFLGSPWAGVILSMAILCPLLYWALLTWLPRPWAFTGTLIVVSLQLSVLSYWTNSYWGGCVPAIGGTLVFGSLLRLRDRDHLGFSLLAIAGLLILLNSRPLEGILLTAITAVAILYWTFVSEQISLLAFSRQIVPAFLIGCLVAIAFAAFYNKRVTGSAKTFPYALYRSDFGVPQGFFWQPPVLVQESMPSDIRAEYEDQLRQHERRTSLKALLGATGGKLRRFWEFYIGVPLTVVLLFVPLIWRTQEMRLALWTLLVILCFDNLTFFAYFPHYSAAVLVLIVLVIVQCIRRMRASGLGGLFLSRTLPLVCVAGLAIPLCGRWLDHALPPGIARLKDLWQPEFAHDIGRENFMPKLERENGRQLVLVRYKPYDGQKKTEWIYNRANIESAKIIWARDSEDPQTIHELLRHFSGRKVWLAEPDANPPRLTPYSDLR